MVRGMTRLCYFGTNHTPFRKSKLQLPTSPVKSAPFQNVLTPTAEMLLNVQQLIQFDPEFDPVCHGIEFYDIVEMVARQRQ
jgi:hypothetical protein